MSSKPKVLMIVTLDTKAVEAQFVRQTLEAEGVDMVQLTILVNLIPLRKRSPRRVKRQECSESFEVGNYLLMRKEKL